MTINVSEMRPGSKVRFAHPDNGYPHDQLNARMHLRPDRLYTIESIDVHAWHTNIWLKEVPGVAFNSVMFEDYNEISTTEIPYRIRKSVQG